MSTLETTLAANVQHRKDAQELISLIGDKPQRFWEVLAEEVAKLLPQPEVEPAEEPMDYSEAMLFERQTAMPYGAYAGNLIGETPREYLAKILDPSPFNVLLRRYVRSRQFQERNE